MVTHKKEHREKRPARQGSEEIKSSPNKIGASTPYEFKGKSLTAYGGLLPVATMLEKFSFQALVEETITCSRETRVMSLYKFVLGIVLGLYVGFPRLNQLRFIAGDPMLTGILKEPRLPPQSTLWRFLASLHLNVAAQILSIQRSMRQRVWQTANIQLQTVTWRRTVPCTRSTAIRWGLATATTRRTKGRRAISPYSTFMRAHGSSRNGASIT